MEVSQAVTVVQEILRRDKDARDTFCGVLCEKYRQALKTLIAQAVQRSAEQPTKPDTSPGVREHLTDGYPGGNHGNGASRLGAVTVTYTGDGSRVPVPFIRLRGKWLERLGWPTGTKVAVHAGTMSITLTKKLAGIESPERAA